MKAAAIPSTRPNPAAVPAATAPRAAADAGRSGISPAVLRILGLSVPVSVILAERLMSVSSILAIRVGTIIEFDARYDSELTLQVADRVIGKGIAVKVGENFGLRLSSIDTVEGRIDALGHGRD